MKRDYLSYSALKAFGKSPNHYIQYVNGERVESPEMKFGTAFHTYILEPHLFEEKYYVMPKVDRRTKAGKLDFEKHTNLSSDRIVIDEGDLSKIFEMAASIKNNEIAHSMMSEAGTSEVPLTGKIKGVEFKGFADRITQFGVWDLKTTQDAEAKGFQRSAYNMDYFLQAAVYSELTGRKDMRWLAVEKLPPYNVGVFQINRESLAFSRLRLLRLVDEFKAWDGKPRSYNDHVQTLWLPNWA